MDRFIHDFLGEEGGMRVFRQKLYPAFIRIRPLEKRKGVVLLL